MRDEDGSASGSNSHPGSAEATTDAITPIVAEAAGRVLDILRSQGRGRFEEAARWTRRRLELAQATRDIESLYNKLGRELVCLVEAEEVAHPGLVKRARRIREEEARLLAAQADRSAPLQAGAGEE